MGIKRIKIQSQRITSFGYLKKIQNQRTAANSGYFKKNITELSGFTKTQNRTAGFHENPEKRNQAGFWAVILLLQFGIWVSGPRQMDRRDLGFRTSTNKLIEEIARCFTDLSLPPPPKTSVTNRFIEFIYMIWTKILKKVLLLLFFFFGGGSTYGLWVLVGYTSVHKCCSFKG
jgi:hypothetical protein